MYIPRHIETVLKRISARKSVVVLTGARQVGKSTMLKTTLPGIAYIALDNPLVRQSAFENPSQFFDAHCPPVIVDEIQKVGSLFDCVKERVDESETAAGQYFLTGSQSLQLMKNVSESLAGRAGVIKMLGLSIRELEGLPPSVPFLPSREFLSNGTAGIFDYQKIITRIHMGFFPELYGNPIRDLHDWADFHNSYLQTYIEKDIRDALQIQDEAAFIKFIRAVASFSSQLLNYKSLSEVCGKDAKTVRRWLSVLESSGLVYLLEPYYNNHNKRLIKTPKMYFLDTGLLCWLVGWNTPEQLANGAMWGAIFETFVVAEILKSYYNDGITRPPLFFYRDKDKHEIDLLIQDGGILHPVEIKSGSDPEKSAVSAFHLLDKIPGIRRGTGAIICMAKQKLPLNDTDCIFPVNGI